MIRAFLTGEKGFIAKNLIRVAKDRINFINDEAAGSDNFLFCNNGKGEFDFASTFGISVLKKELKRVRCDVIIHNGATVGTDVCGLHPKDAVLNNVYGTYNIATLAKELNIPVVYIGTTVIYDTQAHQNSYITERSYIYPRTLYATTKYEGELIVQAYCQDSGYCILRPLFCYGGEGDMNSLIAKAIFNDVSGRKKPFKIFLNPEKIKDYMHVDDFCRAIVEATTMKTIRTSNIDYNISADDPIPTSLIEEEIKYVGIDTSYIQWVPSTDYLGNHRVENSRFKEMTRGCWEPEISLSTGVRWVYEDMTKNIESDYNPFKHLDSIEKNNINIETHYNFKG
jgi:nucleoside-diphosphate-sugar epimerase